VYGMTGTSDRVVGRGGAARMKGAVPLSDRELLQRVRAGDPGSFDQLVRRHLEPAVRLATRLLGDDDAAEDVVQESFLAVLDAADTFDPGRRFAPWFYRIVANRCANVKRTWSRRPTEGLSPTLESPGPGPDREAERSVLRARLERGLASLPERQRQVLMLYEVEGFTGPEIAEALGISPGTVRWHLHQGRAAMRAILEAEEEG
jgi:RNA polymerase sigma-70 factor, ECF subfamily